MEKKVNSAIGLLQIDPARGDFRNTKAIWDIPNMTLQKVSNIPSKALGEIFPEKMLIHPGEGVTIAKICMKLNLPKTAELCASISGGYYVRCFKKVMLSIAREAGNGNETLGEKKAKIILAKVSGKFSIGSIILKSISPSPKTKQDLWEEINELITSHEDNSDFVSATMLLSQMRTRISPFIDVIGVLPFVNPLPAYFKDLEQRLIKLIIRGGNPIHAIIVLENAGHIEPDDLYSLVNIIANTSKGFYSKMEIIKYFFEFGLRKGGVPKKQNLQVTTIICNITGEWDWDLGAIQDISIMKSFQCLQKHHRTLIEIGMRNATM